METYIDDCLRLRRTNVDNQGTRSSGERRHVRSAEQSRQRSEQVGRRQFDGDPNAHCTARALSSHLRTKQNAQRHWPLCGGALLLARGLVGLDNDARGLFRGSRCSNGDAAARDTGMAPVPSRRRGHRRPSAGWSISTAEQTNSQVAKNARRK